MKQYLIRFKTLTNRAGFAVITANSVNTAKTILQHQGQYITEGYDIIDTKEVYYECDLNSIITEIATDAVEIVVNTPQCLIYVDGTTLKMDSPQIRVITIENQNIALIEEGYVQGTTLYLN